MDDPSQNRIDLSGIHPLKRVTLLVLGFMFWLSLTIALTTQIAWMDVCFRSPRGTFIVSTGARGLTLYGAPDDALPFQFVVYHGGITGDSSTRQQYRFRFGSASNTKHYLIAVPGLEFQRIRNQANRVDNYIRLHHAWLITVTAALYLFTHWRIRRAARIQNTPC